MVLNEVGVNFTFDKNNKDDKWSEFEYGWYYVPTGASGTKVVYTYSTQAFVKLLRHWNRIPHSYIYYPNNKK